MYPANIRSHQPVRWLEKFLKKCFQKVSQKKVLGYDKVVGQKRLANFGGVI